MLDDTEKEIIRSKDTNARVSSDNALLRREIDKLMAEVYDIRKELDFQQGRNLDMSAQIRDQELRLKEKDDNLFALRREIDSLKFSNSQMRDSNIELLNEKDALEKHAQVLQSQNLDIQRELDKFCETDEMVRSQLDRRGRVVSIRSKNENELVRSYHKIEDVRSRSPQRRY